MRTRTTSPLFTARANGQVIRRTKPQLSTHARTQQILRELGEDAAQVLRDLRWANLARQLPILGGKYAE